MSANEICDGTMCCLCQGALHSRHTHPEGWKSGLKMFLEGEIDVIGLGSMQLQCVCRACYMDARRCMSKQDSGKEYAFRWAKGKPIKFQTCCVPSCGEEARVFSHSFTWQDICSAVGIASTSEIDAPSLCNRHYQLVTSLVNVYRQSCQACGCRRKHVSSAMSVFRTCPNPKFVESHLKDAVGFTSEIREGDLLCYNCYKYFTQLLRHTACVLSSEDVLKELKCKENQLKEYILRFTCNSDDSYVELALYKTLLVCRLISSEQAFLFPTMYRTFLDYLPETLRVSDVICTSKSRLLTFLGNEFGQLLSSFCHHKRTGTVFHRTKADLSALLSNSLCKQQPEVKASPCNSLNDSMHKIIKHLLSESKDNERSMLLDLDQFIATVHKLAPELWDHVCTVTQSINERKGRRAASAEYTLFAKLKRVRRAYLLAVALFVTNDECSTPFHLLLADTVECCGGSTELITILNRIGATASVDSLKRTVHSISYE